MFWHLVCDLKCSNPFCSPLKKIGKSFITTTILVGFPVSVFWGVAICFIRPSWMLSPSNSSSTIWIPKDSQQRDCATHAGKRVKQMDPPQDSSFFSLSVTMVMTWQISTFVTTMVTERSGGGMVSNQRTMRNIHSEFNFYCTLRHLQFWMVYSTYFWKRKNGCCFNPFPPI